MNQLMKYFTMFFIGIVLMVFEFTIIGGLLMVPFMLTVIVALIKSRG